MKLDGRVALVTGAGRGIGKEIAYQLAREGADLIIVNRNQSLAEPVKAEIEGMGRRCLACQLDISNTEKVQELLKNIQEQFDKIDILVNNAGVTKDDLFLRMTLEEWQQVMDVNLTGTFNITKAVIRGMIKKKYGRIIHISSVVGFTGNPGQANYSASKSALIGFSKSLARELGGRNITSNVVAPGFIETDMTNALTDAQREGILQQIPLGRIGSPHDIAHAVEFLSSEQASYITGTTLHVNGGMF